MIYKADCVALSRRTRVQYQIKIAPVSKNTCLSRAPIKSRYHSRAHCLMNLFIEEVPKIKTYGPDRDLNPGPVTFMLCKTKRAGTRSDNHTTRPSLKGVSEILARSGGVTYGHKFSGVAQILYISIDFTAMWLLSQKFEDIVRSELVIKYDAIRSIYSHRVYAVR